LDELVSAGIASSAVALIGTADRIDWQGGTVSPETRFDFASLTKPFVATLGVVLDDMGVLPLATRVGEVWPEADARLARRPLSDLLRHRSGLAAWAPLYHLCKSRAEALALLLDGSRMGARAGTYSDLDFLLFGLAVERATGEALHEVLRARVLDPLGLTAGPSPGALPDVAESRMDTGQEVRLAAGLGIAIPTLPSPPLGLPQDGNARFLVGLEGEAEGGAGRMMGHAGLFGPARDLWALGAEWLSPGRLLKPEAVAAALAGGGSYAFGWRRRSLRGSAGPALSRSSFGHTGFAGGSLWIDPEVGRILVLLSSRNDWRSDINHWRRRFHRLAFDTILKGGL
jgi:CubicO group peptidase (beta-lactamase class C family)